MEFKRRFGRSFQYSKKDEEKKAVDDISNQSNSSQEFQPYNFPENVNTKLPKF